MRARKAERCLQRAAAALDDGSILEANAALDEARQLSADDPRLHELSVRLEALKQPAPPTNRRYGWMGVAAAGCVLFAATSWQAWTHKEQLSQLLLKPQRPTEQTDMSAGLAPPSSSAGAMDARNDAAGVPTSTTGTSSQLTIQTTLIRPDTVTDARTEAEDAEVDGEIASTPIAEDNSRNPRTDARNAFATLRSPEPVTPSQLDTPSLAVSESRPPAAVAAAPTPSTATTYIPSVIPPPEPLRTVNPAATNSSPAETAAIPPTPSPSTANASAGAAASAVRDDRVAIRAALSRYEAAYNRLDVNAVRSVWPSLDQRALARAFDNLNAQRVSLQACNVDVSGNTARANCSGNASWTPKVGGGERSAARKWTFDLSDSDEGWRIVHVQAR
jgi:hypothetical protein